MTWQQHWHKYGRRLNTRRRKARQTCSTYAMSYYVLNVRKPSANGNGISPDSNRRQLTPPLKMPGASAT
jgi:hypothetical protein